MAEDVTNTGENAQGKKERKEEKATAATAEEENYRERLLRLAAEFDNYKKRIKSDVDMAKAFGKAEMVRDLLPVLDEFELAIIAMKQSSDKELVKGFELLYSNFASALKKAGLREIKTDGKFDPSVHEIMMAQEDGSKRPGTIIEVTMKGYTLGDILLRPASVIITKEQAPENGEKEKKN